MKDKARQAAKRRKPELTEVVQVVVQDVKLNLHVRRGCSDVKLLDEILKNKYYAPRTRFGRSFVNDQSLSWHLVDVGGNIGAASVFLVNHHIQGRLRHVDFFEPETTNMGLAKKNLRGLNAGRGFQFHVAALVATERTYNGEIGFSVSQNPYRRWQPCITQYEVCANVTHQRVKAINLPLHCKESHSLQCS